MSERLVGALGVVLEETFDKYYELYRLLGRISWIPMWEDIDGERYTYFGCPWCKAKLAANSDGVHEPNCPKQKAMDKYPGNLYG